MLDDAWKSREKYVSARKAHIQPKIPVREYVNGIFIKNFFKFFARATLMIVMPQGITKAM